MDTIRVNHKNRPSVRTYMATNVISYQEVWDILLSDFIANLTAQQKTDINNLIK